MTLRETRVREDHAPSSDSTGDEPIRYMLFAGRIGVPTFRLYLRTLANAVIWLGLPPLFGRLLGHFNARRWLTRLQRWWARGVQRALALEVTIEGREYIDPAESYIVVALHEGFADALALLQLPLSVRFVVGDELATWWLLGPYLRDTQQLIINPEHGLRSYRQLRRAAQSVVASGESIVIFPQGTILGIETDFLDGAFALARALRRPILPIALTGSHRVWEHPYTPRLRYGQRISMRVLPPIPAELHCATSLEVTRCAVRRSLKAAALDGVMASPRHFVPERDGYWDGYAYQIDPDFTELAAMVAQHRGAVASRQA